MAELMSVEEFGALVIKYARECCAVQTIARAGSFGRQFDDALALKRGYTKKLNATYRAALEAAEGRKK